ncbi:fimbria/pilus outer membrane usher protein [Arenibaculum pallidiluteum]|uniref:fimbria/pilus outer membrane usher protein n=1 Tax=Arenibaculum pallidiluteum TaxID=2812559 RepID=UPI001A97713F|nr:fimbria/pilus outer membrane usher protein [Arenibaculum pallidiluteum]
MTAGRGGFRPLRVAAVAVTMALALFARASAAQTAAPSTAPSSAQDIFRQVFGTRGKDRPQPAAQAITVPVLVDGRDAGALRARIADDPSAVAVDPRELAELLEPLAQPDLAAAIRSVETGPAGTAPLAGIAAKDVAAVYDPGELAVKVVLRPEQRRTRTIDLGPSPRAGAVQLRPAFLSAYANLRATGGHQDLAGPQDEDGRLPLRLTAESYLSLDSWVLEAALFYQESGGEPRWRRGDVRLVRDLPEHGIRLSAGDVGYPVASFQAGRPLGGAAIARDFLLQPYSTYQPTGQRDFVLTEASTVEVTVNGRPTRTFRLAPGPYSLQNFPGTSGTNDVRIRITDPFGRDQVIEFPFFLDRQLLAPGVHEFAYAAGAPSSLRRGRMVYDGDRPTVSGLHRLGLGETLTLGLNAQADPHFRQVGGEALLATALGTFSVEPTFSSLDGTGSDFAGALRYRDYRSGADFWHRRTVTAQATWRGADFATLGTDRPSNTQAWDLSARIGQPVAPAVTVTLGGRYQASRSETSSDSHSIELGTRARLLPGVDFDVTASRQRDATGRDELLVFAGLRVILGDARNSAALTYSSPEHETRAQWRYQDLEPVRSLSASLEVARGDEGDAAFGDAAYVHDRFAGTLRHERIERLGGEGRQGGYDRRSTATFATGIAFADGHVGLTRPITDGFAIVTPHPRIAGLAHGVDPAGESYLARSDWLGPAVVPNLSAYRMREVLVDVPETPAGYDLGEDRPTLMPGYRSGILLPVGTDAVASATGILRGADGTPVALQSGRFVPEASGDPIVFFTNRGGRFLVEGLRPGRWTLVLQDGRAARVEIPPGSEGRLDLGIIQPGTVQP